MIKFFHTLKCLALVMFALPLAMASCSDDDDSDAPAVKFPETQIINCKAGDNVTLEFDAQSSWKLTSTAVWCKFVQGGETLLSAAGQAGKQTLTVSISDEGTMLDGNSIAKLTLYMEGQQGILAELNRSAEGYELKVYDAEGNEVDAITVGYNSYETFQVKANFAFAATNFPDWAELRGGSVTGPANRMVEGGIRVVPNGDVEKNENEGTIMFQDMKGNSSFSVRVVYKGMDRDAIIIEQPSGNSWNWKVGTDGETWTHEGNTYDKFITCKISAYHDDYQLVYVEEDADGKFHINGVNGADVSWMRFNKETGRLTVDPSSVETRTGYVFAFPAAVYNAISGNLADALISTEDGEEELDYRYSQNNLVVAVKQQDEKTTGGGSVVGDEVGFIATCFDESWNKIDVECFRITDKSILDHVETIAGTREVFLLDYRSPRGRFDMVKPYPEMQNDDDWDSDLAYFIDNDGNRIEDRVPEASFADSETPSYWYIMGCSNSEEPIIMVMLNKDKSVMKALYIKTKAE